MIIADLLKCRFKKLDHKNTDLIDSNVWTRGKLEADELYIDFAETSIVFYMNYGLLM